MKKLDPQTCTPEDLRKAYPYQCTDINLVSTAAYQYIGYLNTGLSLRAFSYFDSNMYGIFHISNYLNSTNVAMFVQPVW